jgi:hypothetical protein
MHTQKSPKSEGRRTGNGLPPNAHRRKTTAAGVGRVARTDGRRGRNHQSPDRLAADGARCASRPFFFYFTRRRRQKARGGDGADSNPGHITKDVDNLATWRLTPTPGRRRAQKLGWNFYFFVKYFPHIFASAKFGPTGRRRPNPRGVEISAPASGRRQRRRAPLKSTADRRRDRIADLPKAGKTTRTTKTIEHHKKHTRARAAQCHRESAPPPHGRMCARHLASTSAKTNSFVRMRAIPARSTRKRTLAPRIPRTLKNIHTQEIIHSNFLPYIKHHDNRQ